MNPGLPTRLRDVVGDAGLITDHEEMRGYMSDLRGAYSRTAALVVRPGSTAEVVAVVALCREAAVALAPQGGNELTRIVYDTTRSFHGSISAEQGLGQSKVGIIADYKTPMSCS